MFFLRAGVSRQVPLRIENKGKIAATLYFDMSMHPDFDLIVPSASGAGGAGGGGGEDEDDMSRATTAVSVADGGAASSAGGPLVPLPSGKICCFICFAKRERKKTSRNLRRVLRDKL